MSLLLISFGRIALQKLDPFDSEINFLAQGDSSWEAILYKST